MAVILAIIGAIIGASSRGFDEFYGLLGGGLLGYLLGSVFNLRKQISALQQDVKLLVAAHSKQKAEISTPAQSTLTASSIAAATAPHTASIAVPATQAPLKEIDIPAVQIVNTQPTRTRPAIQPVEDPAIIRYIKNYFSGENILARVGVIVLFFGVAFLLKYAAEHTHLPIEFRLMGIALGAIVMLVIGWRLRTRHEDYALVLQGGSIGVLYLTVFAALRLYQALPPTLSFFIMLAVVVFSAVLAVLQNARSLAILGICGGFLAPILTSTGDGSHVMLFSYYALLNAGIFGMSWFKAWRPLNLLGFLFTFVIATYWGVTRYSAADFASTEPFLILFFLFYVAISVLYANRQAPELKAYVDGTLVFGTPIIAFGLQAGMMQQYDMLQIFEKDLSVSAVVLSLFYLALAKVLFDRQRNTLRLLVESFIALSIVFATLAIPLALDARWTSASWALEGAAVVWMGIRQNRWLARLFGCLLQFAAGLALIDDNHYFAGVLPILNSVFLGGALLSFAGLFCAWYMQRNQPVLKIYEHSLAHVLFTWGVLWWLGAGLREIEKFVIHEYAYAAVLLYVALSSGTFSLLMRKLSWPVARIPAFGLLPALWLIAGIQLIAVSHPFAGVAWLGWLVAFAIIYLILHRNEHMLSAAAVRNFHMGTLWLLTLLASREAAWAINDLVQGQGTWPMIVWALMPGLILAIITLRGEKIRWPLAEHLQNYLNGAALPLVLFLWLWTLFSNFNSDGNPYPITYIPLLNPLDLAQIFVFIVLVFWWLEIRELDIPVLPELPHKAIYALLACAVFVWLNAGLLRTLHYWADVPFNRDSMMHSVLVQTSISIFWSVLAMGLMRYAAKNQLRILWIIGGVLMGAVVLKLFTIDISGIGSLERIVSFIGVAVLMLIIGYIAPLPPKQKMEGEHA
jgi:uncharacterized membrane protein